MPQTAIKRSTGDSQKAPADLLGPDPWEAAYLRFETPEQEIRKFVRRLQKVGVLKWPRRAEIVELFCGRGNGLHALQRLGFSHIEGVDLSARLVAQYRGDAHCTVCDCRELPFKDRSKDALIVQGGLHHLSVLPDDLLKTVSQMHRVLKENGKLLLVEPWLTPFLKLAHLTCGSRLARRLSKKVDALATMIEFERSTYEEWLARPSMIRNIVYSEFVPIHQSFSWGKWTFVGRPA
jgi:ubiquinone/menaquinone biosynthesis C-methylase UbiE